MGYLHIQYQLPIVILLVSFRDWTIITIEVDTSARNSVNKPLLSLLLFLVLCTLYTQQFNEPKSGVTTQEFF